MQKYTDYLDEEFIIWNADLGMRDFVSIGKIDEDKDITVAWLEEPYEMVGPFSLDELLITGRITFAACIVMSGKKWEENQATLRRESFRRQRKTQREFYENVNRYNQRKENQNQKNKIFSEKNYRELLSLPLSGLLKENQIKSAYRIVVKKVHPDVGGSHEEFIQVTEARDILLSKIS